MSRRRLLLFAVMAVVVVLAVGPWLPWPRTAITLENAAKIQIGMMLAEAEAILGGPARDESTDLDIVVQPNENEDDPEVVIRVRTWLEYARAAGQVEVEVYHWGSDRAIVVVILGDAGRVQHSHSGPVRHMLGNPQGLPRP